MVDRYVVHLAGFKAVAQVDGEALIMDRKAIHIAARKLIDRVLAIEAIEKCI